MNRPPLARIARHLLDGVAAVMLLASLGVVAVWARSCHEPEHFWACHRSGRIDSFKADRGHFTFARRHTPYRLRVAATYREAGPHVLPRFATGSYPVERRWGPVAYAAAPPGPAPTAEQVRRVWERFAAAQAFDAVAWPDDPAERRDWAARRARAYREAFAAERPVKAANTSLWVVVVPAWLVLLPLAALPALRAAPAWRRWKAWQASRPRTCESCGGEFGPGAATCPACFDAVAPKRSDAAPPAAAPAPADVAGTEAALPYPLAPDLPRRVRYAPGPRLHVRPPPRRPRPTP